MTILETIPIFEQPGNYMSILLGSIITTIILLIIAGIFFQESFDGGGVFFTILAIIGVLIFLGSLILTITEPKIDTGRKQYIIRLDNDVAMNDFYDKYKIVEHTKYTDVYVVEEINNAN